MDSLCGASYATFLLQCLHGVPMCSYTSVADHCIPQIFKTSTDLFLMIYIHSSASSVIFDVRQSKFATCYSEDFPAKSRHIFLQSYPICVCVIFVLDLAQGLDLSYMPTYNLMSKAFIGMIITPPAKCFQSFYYNQLGKKKSAILKT